MELQVVRCVLRHQHGLNALPHLGPLISNFLGPDANLSLTEACEFGSIRLLDWVWSCSPTTAATRTATWTLINYLRSEAAYYRYQFYEGIQVAAKKGDLPLVQWFFDYFSGCEVPSEAVAAAASKGHLQILQFLLANDAGRDCERKRTKVELDIDEWVDSVPVMPSNWSGPGNVVRWGGKSLLAATAAQKLEVARWLYDNTPHQTQEDDIHAVVERAVMNGDFEFAEFLLPRGRKLEDYVGILMRPQAIEKMLKRGFLKQKKDAAAAAIWISAKEGNLEMMKRIAGQHPKPPRGKNSEWLRFWTYAMTDSCERGDVEMIKWVFDHPTGKLLRKQMQADGIMERLDEMTAHAASGGNIKAMEYLVSIGCTDKYAHAMVNAARKGHLHCIEWLLEHTYQFHPSGSADRVVVEAAKLGYLNILEFFHAPRYASEEMSAKRRKIEDAGAWWKRSRDAMDEAAANGQLDVVKWLYANRSEGCTTAAMDGAARNGHLEMLVWLDKITNEGCTEKAMQQAAMKGHLEVVKWLATSRKEECSVEVVEYAIISNNLRVASFLRKTFPQYAPDKGDLWIWPRNIFDTLLFIQANYPDVFTLDFGRHTRVSLTSDCSKGCDLLTLKWLEEHYAGHPSKKTKETFFWIM